jgi:glycosyltransferase involved in cell wall biosynthesis
MRQNSPLLTIIIPAYNVEKFIEACLLSILHQTFFDYELLILDDGSTDRTKKTIKKFHDSRIRFYQNEGNIGKVRSVNMLYQYAKGKYITIHDSDDLSDKNRFTKQVEFLEHNPDYVLCGTNFYTISDSGKIINKSSLVLDYNSIKRNIYQQSQFHGPTIVFRREIIEKVGGLYREYFIVAEDIEFTTRVVEKYKCCNMPEHLYYYRQHSSSLTKHFKNYSPERYALKELMAYLNNERNSNGYDSLWNTPRSNEVDKVYQKYIELWEVRESQIYLDGIARSLSFNFYMTAIRLNLKWIYKANMSKQSLKTILYIIKHLYENNIAPFFKGS